MHRSRRAFVATLLLALPLWAASLRAQVAPIPFVSVVIDADNPRTPDCKAVGDIDGDGFPDVIIASSEEDGVHWYRYPTWARHAIRPGGTYTTDMQVADIDGDGDLDVVVPAAHGLVWYENPRPGGDPATAFWPEHLIGAAGAHNHDVEVGDLNGDGRPDVVTRPHGGGGTNAWFQAAPTVWVRLVVGDDPGEGTALGDIDGDGDLDIAHNGVWLENPLPAGGLSAPWPRHEFAPGAPHDVGVLVADIDGDGRNDLVLAPSESAGRPFVWYESATPRTGPWTAHVIDPAVSYFHTFKAADMDGDGDLDLVTAEMHQSSDPDEVSVYRSEGGGLAWSKQVVATTGSHNLRVADIGSDGDIDIIGANWSDGAQDSAVIRLWENTRAGNPPPAPPRLALSLSAGAFRAADTMIVVATLTPGALASPVDAYVAAQLPDGTLLSLTEDGRLVPGLRPLARGLVPFAFTGEVLRHTLTGGEPAGAYAWLAALTRAGTAEILGVVDQQPFTVGP
jgi:hypothetical protein